MKKMMSLAKRYAADESGATALEYGLIAGLIGLSIVVGASKLAANSDSAWQEMASTVEGVS